MLVNPRLKVTVIMIPDTVADPVVRLAVNDVSFPESVQQVGEVPPAAPTTPVGARLLPMMWEKAQSPKAWPLFWSPSCITFPAAPLPPLETIPRFEILNPLNPLAEPAAAWTAYWKLTMPNPFMVAIELLPVEAGTPGPVIKKLGVLTPLHPCWRVVVAAVLADPVHPVPVRFIIGLACAAPDVAAVVLAQVQLTAEVWLNVVPNAALASVKAPAALVIELHAELPPPPLYWGIFNVAVEEL
jgi:hypothetical protein